MGCGESKHDVATGNTITRKKSDVSKKSKDVETIQETIKNDNKTSSLVEQGNNQNVRDNLDNADNVADHVKDLIESKEFKEGKETEKEGGDLKGDEDPGRLISKESPNRFFSSRKDHEDVEGVASEGRSENDYYSPHHEAGKESLFNENFKMNGESLVEETKLETKKDEPVTVKEDDLGKEISTATNAEPKATNLAVEEKQNGQEEAPGSPTKDLKAT